MRLVWPLTALMLTVCTPTQADPPRVAPAPSTAPLRVRIDAPLRELAVPLSDSVLGHLRARSWTRAADGLVAMDSNSLVGDQKGSWAFVTAWSLVRADRAGEAVPMLPLIEGVSGLPQDDVALLAAEILRADGKLLQAVTSLERVPEHSPRYGRAAVVRAELFREI